MHLGKSIVYPNLIFILIYCLQYIHMEYLIVHYNNYTKNMLKAIYLRAFFKEKGVVSFYRSLNIAFDSSQ